MNKPTLGHNRFDEMLVFTKVVELEGFSAAARYFVKTPSAISKLIQRLETRLGTRLFLRSTRQLALTQEGQDFYHQCVTILANIAHAEQQVHKAHEPQGNIKISASIPVGKHYLLPLMPAFTAQYPKVTLDLQLTDEITNLMATGCDVALRFGNLPDSTLFAKHVCDTELVIVASPNYLKKHGTPTHAQDLRQHHCLTFSLPAQQKAWITKDGQAFYPSGPCSVSDGDAMHQLALSGMGLARLAHFQVAKDLASGRLVEVLSKPFQQERYPLHAVYLQPSKALPKRVRVLLEWLTNIPNPTKLD